MHSYETKLSLKEYEHVRILLRYTEFAYQFNFHESLPLSVLKRDLRYFLWRHHLHTFGEKNKDV